MLSVNTLLTADMTVVTAVSLRHLSGALVRSLTIDAGGRLGRLFTSFRLQASS